MAVRRKRSVSIPPSLDAAIAAAAQASGTTYSAWVAAAAHKELLIQDGLEAVAEFERTHGAFSAEELAEGDTWAQDAIERSRRSGEARRRSA